MKTSLFYIGLLFLCVMTFSSCGIAGIPIQNKAPQNNDTYTISYLFEHDGVKVYRFMTWEIMSTSLQKAK